MMNKFRFLFFLLFFISSTFRFDCFASISKEDSLKIISLFEKELISPVQNKFNAHFKIFFNTDVVLQRPLVAASADRSENDWNISILGASSLHPKMTNDAFVILLCHELGHHFGGAPRKIETDGKIRWSSVEGQADYYATAICAKRIFELMPASFFDSFTYPREIKKKCEENSRSRKAMLLCARSIIASEAFIQAVTERNLDWWSTDSRIPQSTIGVYPVSNNYEYPSDECRMNTLVLGSLCQEVISPNNDDLLGLTKNKIFCSGQFSRPSCWYTGSN